MSASPTEIIIVRSLTDSDLGLFAAHRASARSKQRAIHFNADIARRLLDPELFERGEARLNCVCIFGDTVIREARWFGKTHKNWRLGGKKIEGKAFANLDSKDFILFRTFAPNDGSHPITISFIARQVDRVLHAGLAAIVERELADSMAVFAKGADGFEDIAGHCPTIS